MFDSTNYEIVAWGVLISSWLAIGTIVTAGASRRASRKLRVVLASSGVTALVISGVVTLTNPYEDKVGQYKGWLAEKYGVSLVVNEARLVGFMMEWADLADGEPVAVVNSDGEIIQVEMQGSDDAPVLVNADTKVELPSPAEGDGGQ